MTKFIFSPEERERAIKVLMEDLNIKTPTRLNQPVKRETLHAHRAKKEKRNS